MPKPRDWRSQSTNECGSKKFDNYRHNRWYKFVKNINLDAEYRSANTVILKNLPHHILPLLVGMKLFSVGHFQTLHSDSFWRQARARPQVK